MESIQNIKQRYGIIGNDYMLNKSLEKTMLVAPTDLSVMVVGESGVGKEFIPKIIHQLSARKHNVYIAINCGAIPEGTINSELFGHEKGAFTGAINSRKGYFEVANGGTIFLDEIGELPLSTQIRLLRILESGEFIKVGSSKVQKTNVRIVTATNINMIEAINNKKFREDLYYRINTIQIDIPPLRYRKGDINILYKKFSHDFAEKYNITPIKLTEQAINYIEQYNWPGNIRQLRNIVEQLSILEKNNISLEILKDYIPTNNSSLIHLSNETKKNDIEKLYNSSLIHISNETKKNDIEKLYNSSLIHISNETKKNDIEKLYNSSLIHLSNETKKNDIEKLLYKALFNMRKDLNNLKILLLQLIRNNNNDANFNKKNSKLIEKIFGNEIDEKRYQLEHNNDLDNYQEPNESLYLKKKELEFICKALKKNNGKRKISAKELGISERTLYRKIKEYGLNKKFFNTY
ncbi:MAG: sigma 54-interacting transcriptional regulator [Candidatus Bostrichicola ureolyticus]|nr:MAG: sigma 54-interacting transcriptional regulator [Candidatus Bostrichicola ureolyticus]